MKNFVFRDEIKTKLMKMSKFIMSKKKKLLGRYFLCEMALKLNIGLC